MPKRFYLSTRKDRVSEAAVVRETLIRHGWEQTFDWTNAEAVPVGDTEIALAELEGVRNADLVIVLLPGGFGTHVEIGAALALGKPVILHSANQAILETPYRCVFHYHPGVRLVVSPLLDLAEVLDLR